MKHTLLGLHRWCVMCGARTDTSGSRAYAWCRNCRAALVCRCPWWRVPQSLLLKLRRVRRPR